MKVVSSVTHLNVEFQRIAKRDKKAILSDQCKEIEENNRMGISSRKIEITREHFMQRWAQPRLNHEEIKNPNIVIPSKELNQ